MKKIIFTILLFAFVLSSAKANKYTCWLAVADADTSFLYIKDFNKANWAYPLFEYSYVVKTNSNAIGSGVGKYTIKLTNGTFSDNGTTQLDVFENISFKVKWNDMSGSGVINISNADPFFPNADSITMGTPISFTYKIATQKGQTPNIILSNSNQSMGDTQPITAQLWSDMTYPGIYVSNGLGGYKDLLVSYYEWTIPSGWKAVASGTKTGTFTLSAAASENGISITPDNFTAGEVKVRAMNALGSAGSEYKTFPIDRGFSFTAYPASIAYGDNTPRTFSVSSFPGVTYEWSAPSDWQINGQGNTLEGLNLNSVSMTPSICSYDNTINVRLKKDNDISQWYGFLTQMTNLPDISSNPSTIYQYEPFTFS